jgi:hypothetical protein
MRQVRKALPDKYFLDKNFYPLLDKIIKELVLSGGYLPLTISPEQFRDIVFGTLQAIRPQYHQLKEVKQND